MSFVARTLGRTVVAGVLAALAVNLAACGVADPVATYPGGPKPANEARPADLVLPHRNLPDPYVLKVGDTYYLYSSQTGFTTPPVPLTESAGDTLFRWHRTEAAMTALPSWAEDGFTWSPDVIRIGNRYVLYFDAWVLKKIYFNPRESGFGQRSQCIGVAVAASPAGPFAPLDEPPLVCQLKDHGDIDPRAFRAPDGRLYLDWKSDDNAFQPARTTHLYAATLSANGEHLTGSMHLLMNGNHVSWAGTLVEAPDMIYAHHTYWLFFSGSWFNGPDYSIGVAVCRGPTGPCTPKTNKPWLTSNAQGRSPGEESLFEDSSGWWIVYSPWDLQERSYRPVALAKVAFGPDGPYLATFRR